MMIIYKCFFRKKTTKIAILLLTISFLVLSILVIGKKSYIDRVNDCYKGSFLEVNNVSDYDLKIVKKNISVNSYEIGLVTENYYLLSKSESLNKEEIILPVQLVEEYKIGDIIELELNDREYNFVIKDFADESSYRLVVSDLIYEELSLGKEKTLRIDVKNWAARDSVAKKLEKKLGKDVSTFVVKKDNVNYDIAINAFTIIISLFILFFSILLVVILYNLVIDESKTNFILYSLGYSKKKLLGLIIKKIFLILSISLVLHFMVLLLFNFIKMIVF